MIFRVLLKRLEEFEISPFVFDSEPWWIDYDNKISVYGLLSRIKKENKIVYCAQEEWTAADHARRIHYLINHPKEFNVPIKMCSYPTGVKNPIPIIEDGWHRLYGHFYLNRKYIKTTWKGSKKMINYLIGKVDTYV